MSIKFMNGTRWKAKEISQQKKKRENSEQVEGEHKKSIKNNESRLEMKLCCEYIFMFHLAMHFTTFHMSLTHFSLFPHRL